MDVLVAPWGNPFGWKTARYRLSGSDKEVEGVTSTLLLLEEISPDIVIISVPETLLSVMKLEEYGGKVLSGGDENYKELILKLKSAIEKFFAEKIREVKQLKVVVAPNIGRYGEVEWILPGRISPDSAYAAYILASIAGLKGNEEITIHLDTTHGINFMPLAAYRAVLAASRIISVVNDVRVKFKQYNSTPYPGSEEIPRLEVFCVKEETITPVKAAQRLVYSYLSRENVKPFRYADIPVRELGDIYERVKNLEERAKRAHEEAEPVASSVHYSMPLAFLQFSRNTEEEVGSLVMDLESLINDLIACVEIKREEKRIKVRHLVMPSYEDLKSFLSALSLISYGEKCTNRISGIRFDNGIVEASINALCDAIEYIKGPLAEVAGHEISIYKNYLEGKMTEIKNELAEKALKRRGDWIPEEGCEDNKRIMIAHAGLARRAIELKFDDNTWWFRYKKDCLQMTENIVKKVLADTRRMVKGEEW